MAANAHRTLAAQAGDGGSRYCVLYVKDGKEACTPWFSRRARARAALTLMKGRYGRAVIYVD